MANSGYIDALLATNFAGRIFRILGSRPVRLSWDVNAKTITIAAVDNGNEVIVSAPVSQVDRAYFVNGVYFIRINGQLYDLQIKYYPSKSTLVNEVAGFVEDLTLIAADSRSGIDDLAALIAENSSEKKVTRSLISSKSYIKVIAIGIVIVLVVGLIVSLYT